MQKILIYQLFWVFISKINTTDSSFKKISKISFASLLFLDIKQNTISANQYKIQSTNDTGFVIASNSTEIKIEKENTRETTLSFGDMNFIIWEPQEVISFVTMSITDNNCASPMIFASKSKPSFEVVDGTGMLDLKNEDNDFLDLFGSDQRIKGSSYTSEEIGTRFFFINLICLYYYEVKTFYFQNNKLANQSE